MNLQVVSIVWCKPISCHSLDAALIPARAGIYEILWDRDSDSERIFMGESDDIRQSMVQHISGRTPFAAVASRVLEPDACFRYWLCDSRVQRSQVAAALWDSYPYECGADWTDLGATCVRVSEED